MESLKQRIERLGGDVEKHRSIAQMVSNLAKDNGIKLTPHECVKLGFSQVMNRIEAAINDENVAEDEAIMNEEEETETKPKPKRKQHGKGKSSR